MALKYQRQDGSDAPRDADAEKNSGCNLALSNVEYAAVEK